MNHHKLTPEELFCLQGCRSYGQYHHMRAQFQDEFCPFCNLSPEINSVLWDDGVAALWRVHPNMHRKELEHHFIIIPKRHIRFPWDLAHDEVLSMHEARKSILPTLNVYGGAIVTRFGDMRYNAGTVPHLHENLMVPNGTGEVRIPVFKDPKDREENEARAAEFARRYEAGEIP